MGKRDERPKVSRATSERPVVRLSYGMSKCLWCKREFEKTRPWSKFDTNYCKMMHWHTLHRRKTAPGVIVEVDGEMLKQPQPAIDQQLDAKVEAEVASARAWGTREK